MTENTTIPLKIAVGMWEIDFKNMGEIMEINHVIHTSRNQYTRFVNRMKKEGLHAFSTMTLDPDESFDRIDFDVGFEKG